MLSDLFHSKVLPVRNKLFRYAYMILNDRDEAEDIVQEVLMKIWMKKENLSAITSIEGWCITVTRNLAFDRLRITKSKYKLPVEMGMNLPSDENPHTRVSREDQLNSVYRFIMELPAKQQQTVFLRDIEGHSYKEISQIMGISENLVKITLFRAREALRRKLLNLESYGL